MKVLVTGAAGMLAQEVLSALEAAGHTLQPHPALDITRLDEVRKAIHGARPDWVVHLAAYTDVDGCEARADHAMKVNGEGSGHVALAAAEVGSAILAMSSDYVFAGDDPRPQREDDLTGPLSAYGRSKLAGEEAVRAANRDHAIVRTAWLYGRGGRNFVDTILDRALAGGALSVVDDQRGSPTWTRDLAGALVKLLAKGVRGTFHATNSGSCTWHEFAVAICEAAGVRVPVARISSAQLERPARRPAHSVLDTSKLQDAIGQALPQWRDAMERYLAQRASVRM